MAQFKSPQSPLFQRGAQVVAFFKGVYWGVAFFQRGDVGLFQSKGAQLTVYNLKNSAPQRLNPKP